MFFLFNMIVNNDRGFGKLIYYAMSNNHISVTPQLLTNYLTILDIKYYCPDKFTKKNFVTEHHSFIIRLWTITSDTLSPLLTFGHVTYQRFLN